MTNLQLTNSPTPETDAICEQWQSRINYPDNPIPAEFARNLERRLAAAVEGLEKIATPALGGKSQQATARLYLRKIKP